MWRVRAREGKLVVRYVGLSGAIGIALVALGASAATGVGKSPGAGLPMALFGCFTFFVWGRLVTIEWDRPAGEVRFETRVGFVVPWSRRRVPLSSVRGFDIEDHGPDEGGRYRLCMRLRDGTELPLVSFLSGDLEELEKVRDRIIDYVARS